jgi:hypothetical protein
MTGEMWMFQEALHRRGSSQWGEQGKAKGSGTEFARAALSRLIGRRTEVRGPGGTWGSSPVGMVGKAQEAGETSSRKFSKSTRC